MDYNLPVTPFDTPQSFNYTVPMTSRKNQDARPTIQIHDASTFEGQQLGAILSVKRTVKAIGFNPSLVKVGDLVEVIAHYNASQVEVKSVRTGVIGYVEWDDLLPIPYDGKCGCMNGGCRCVYETWQTYSARRPLPCLKSIPIYGPQDANMSGMNVPIPAQIPAPPNTISHHDKTEQDKPPEVCDPLTIAGQTPGAVLAVKHHAHHPPDFGPILEVEIGDRCIYLEACEHGWGKVKVKNVRTGKEGFLRWETFKPVSTRVRCSCHKAYCYCEYEDFEKSWDYCETKK